MAGALIGALRVSLSAETTAFEAGMNRAQAIARRTAANINKPFDTTTRILERTALRFAEVLTLAAIVRAGKAALEYAGHLGELADTLGLTTRDLQTFSYAAGQVGISQEELQVGIQKLTISMGQAEVGAKKQINAFNAIGISVDDLKGKNAGDIFRLIAERLEKVTDRSQRAAIEVALFGKAGAKLDNLLSGAQGRLDDLSAAAERLGIVLSEEEIRKADETADKIAALQTVLKARVAGVVADNADSILALANAIGVLVGTIGPAIRGLQQLWAEFKAGAPALALGIGGLPLYGKLADDAAQQFKTRNFLANLPMRPAEFPGKASGRTGGDIGNFLAPGGGGGKARHGRADHSAEELQRKQLEALNKAYDYARDELSAQKDILEAKKDLSEDYVEQTSLSIAILDLERQQYKADLDNQVAQNQITKGKEGINQAQADHLLALYDQADHDKRVKLMNDEQEHRLNDVAMLEDHDIERKRDLLQKLSDLATTQSERRKIELDLLDLAYQEKKQALQRIIDNSKDAAAIEDARRDLAALNANYAADRKGVMNSTAGPLEAWAKSVPHTAAEINEALQSIEVEGLDGLTDAIEGVITGTTSLKEAFHNLAASILADLLKMTIKMLLFKALEAAMGGSFGSGGDSASYANSVAIGNMGFANGGSILVGSGTRGFANGGFMRVGGRSGTDKNLLSLNGLPIARVSYGERINISNDNMRGGGGAPSVTVPIMIDATGADAAGLARVQTQLDQLKAELPGIVVRSWSEANERFYFKAQKR